MKVYRPRSVVSKYYAMLFSLPRWQYLATMFIVIGLSLIISMGDQSFPLLINSSLVFAVISIYAKLYTKSVFYKVKRSIGIALTVLIYSAIFTAITRKALVAISSTSTLIAVVLLGLDGANISRLILASIPSLTTIYVSHVTGYIDLDKLLLGAAIVSVVLALEILIIAFMSRRKINQHSFPAIGTLFLRNWLDRRTEIEEVFDDLGEHQYVNPRMVELGKLAVVYTDVHYGPFSNIGSSRLPKALLDVFRKIGFNDVISLHGLGSHDRNIASSKHMETYIDALVKIYLNSERVPLLYHGSFISEDNEWRALGVVFDKFSLLFVSRPGRGIDDLPYILQVEYELKAKSRGLGDTVIVDSHNWELEDKLDITTLRPLLDRSLLEIERLRHRAPVEVNSKYKCIKTKSLGLIGDELCVLCLGGLEREEACLVYLRGNNMKPGVRDLIIREASHLGTKLIEVITNDEHSETGTRSYIAYIPVHDSPELLEAVRRASQEVTKAQPHRGAWLYASRMDLKLMGRTAIELESLLKRSIRETVVLLLTYVFATPIVLSLLI